MDQRCCERYFALTQIVFSNTVFDRIRIMIKNTTQYPSRNEVIGIVTDEEKIESHHGILEETQNSLLHLEKYLEYFISKGSIFNLGLLLLVPEKIIPGQGRNPIV